MQTELKAAIVRKPLMVSCDETVNTAIALMSRVHSQCGVARTEAEQRANVHIEARSSCVVVTGEHQKVVGIFTERDVVRISAQNSSFYQLSLEQVMSQPVVTLKESEFTDLLATINLLQQHRIRHLPILDDSGEVVGIVTHESLRHITRPIDLLRLRLVGEVMTQQVLCAAPGCSMLNIVNLMAEHCVSSVVIVDSEDKTVGDVCKPLGLLTERDVVQFQALGLNLRKTTAQEVMSAPVVTIPPEESLWKVQQLMEQQLIRRVVVTGKQGELLGIVTQSSLLQAFNPLELYKLAQVLEKKVNLLEAEKVALLESRTIELEREVQERTSAMRTQSDREKLLIELAIQIRSSLDLQTILDTTVRQVRGILGCDRVNIWQVEPDGKTMVVAECTESAFCLVGKRIQDTCFKEYQSEIVSQGWMRVVRDIYITEMSDCHRDMLIELHTRAKILVPLLCGDQVWGFLNASESQAPRNWQASEIELLRALSVHLAIALAQATTYQKLQLELRERQQAEAQLRESEQRYITLAATVPVGIFRTDSSGHCIYVNDYWCELTGISKEEAMGDGWQQGLHPEDSHQVMSLWAQAVGKNRSVQVEFRYQHPDGKVVLVYGQSVPEKDAYGEIIGYVGTITDISDRQQAEQELRNAEKRLREAQRIAHLGNWELNLSNNKLYWSDEVFRIFEINPQKFEASYEAFLRTIHPDDREVVHKAYTQHLCDRTPFNIIHRLLMPDGGIKYVRQQCETLYTQEGTPTLSRGTVQDITLQRATELKREQAEKALRQVVEGTSAVTGESFFPKLVHHMAQALEVSYALVTELADGQLSTLGFWANGELQPCISYSLASSPCEYTLRDGEFYCETFIQRLFPEDSDLVTMKVDSYLGIALKDDQGKAIGNLCILDVQPLSPAKRAEILPILQVFAGRAAAELQRKKVNDELYRLNQNLEGIVEQRTKELQERETRYRALMEGAGDAIVLADFQGNVLEVNRRTEELLGYSRTEMTQMYQFQLHPPEQFWEVVTAFRQVVQGKRSQMLDRQILRQDGQRVPVDISSTIVSIGQTQIIQSIFRDIRDRKQSENILRESQQFLQTVLDTFPLAVFWKDRQSVLLGCNQIFASVSGLKSPLEVVGKTNFDLGNSEAEALSYLADDHLVMESGIAKLGIEETMTLPTGEQRWIETNKLPLRDLSGNVVGVLGTFQDITARVHAQQEIQRQAQREIVLREVTQRIRQSLDLQTIFNIACQEIRQVLQADRVGIFKFYPESGYDDGEFVAESVVEGFPSVVAVRVHDHCFGENYANLYTEGRYYVVEDIYRHGIEVCHTDILAQFQVRANMVMPLLCGDKLWGLLCIHQCSGTHHWHQSEIELSQQLANQLAIALQQALLYEQLQQELTERQHAQHQLTERNEELARATRLKDEFLANMSHELRTPLNAILGMTEGLQEQLFGEINEEQHEALETIERSSFHLLELINDILDVARIESGQLQLECNPISISYLCQSSLAFIKQQAMKKSIQLEIKTPVNLPDLLLDERRIRQVLINLLNNAVKFTPEGGCITLEVSLTPKPKVEGVYRYVRLSVIDTGIGIAQENIKKLFQPFMQIDGSLNRQYQGTGLGLALVKRIVELHDGYVELTSEVGVGSCFTINLPYVKPLSFMDTSESPQDNFDFLQPHQESSPLILIVEDNEANISTISSYLRAKGYALVLAKNGQEAVELAKSASPDLILMDIQMPGMDGLEAMQHIRSDPTLVDLPIIALTALAMEGDRDRCLAAGANDYLTKPVKLKQLVATIQQFLT